MDMRAIKPDGCSARKTFAPNQSKWTIDAEVLIRRQENTHAGAVCSNDAAQLINYLLDRTLDTRLRGVNRKVRLMGWLVRAANARKAA
jgi:hypothetical protein